MLDQAFEALATYDWGVDPAVLKPIGEAVVATHGDAAGRAELEVRLAAVLTSEAPRAAKDYACRQLMIVGTAASVPTLAALLSDKELSHMARYALERIDAPEAGQALREALALNPPELLGVIGSVGARRDTESIADLTTLFLNENERNKAVARAAALALGAMRSAQTASALAQLKPDDAETSVAVIDASLACAEALLADGQAAEALAIYKRFAGEDQPKHVRLAATRGMLACAGKAQ
jgi:hypothetical protein